MTSRSRRAASSLSRTSCATGTLSLKTTTDSPAERASIASTKAAGPGTDTSAMVAGARRGGRGGGAGRLGSRRTRGRPCGRRPQRRVERSQRGGERRLVVGADGDEQVVRPGAVGRGQAQAGEQLEVELGGHGHERGGDPGGRAHGPGDLHERHRVAVGAAAQLDVVGHASPRRSSSARAATSTPVAVSCPEVEPTASRSASAGGHRTRPDERLHEGEDGRRGAAVRGVGEQVGRQGGRRPRPDVERPSAPQVGARDERAGEDVVAGGGQARAEAEQRAGGVREPGRPSRRAAAEQGRPGVQPLRRRTGVRRAARRRAARPARPPRRPAARRACARAASSCARRGSGRRRARAPRRRRPPDRRPRAGRTAPAGCAPRRRGRSAAAGRRS